jgi:hypothetical protein
MQDAFKKLDLAQKIYDETNIGFIDRKRVREEV